LGMTPGLLTGARSVSAQATEELTQREWGDLVEEAEAEDPVFGPEDGDLDHDPDRVTFEYADVQLTDFYLTATFENPSAADDAQFDYGIQFRSFDDGGEARFLRFILISDGTWGLTDGTEDVLATDVYDDIDADRRGENTMSLYVEGDIAHLGINGDYIGSVELTYEEEGEIAVGTAFLADSFQEDATTSFTDFTIWELGGGGRGTDPEEEETPDPEEEETPENGDPEEEETPENGDPEVDGTEYESPTFGYTLVYSDEWEVVTEDSDRDGDILEISNGPSSLQFLGFESRDDPAECIEAIIEDLEDDDTVASVQVAVDNNDEELQGEDDEQAFVVLFIEYETDEGSVFFTAFYQCLVLEEGESLLQITHLALSDDYNDEIEARVEVIDTLSFDGGGADPDPEPTEEGDDPEPTEEGGEELPPGSVTFLLENVDGGSHLIFGTLIPDGDETKVELLALTEEVGIPYEVTIHEGSCRNPGEPVFELGEIDDVGLLDATIDIETEELTNGDYVMIVHEGDFEETAIACGVLEEIPVEEEG
jgi:hypothetical protein